MLIGVDIDGCTYPFTTAVNEAVEAKFGITDLEEHTSWNYLKDRITPAQWGWVWTPDAAEAVFGRCDLIYRGAGEVVNELCRAHEVHFVTHRDPPSVAAITATWLQCHFAGYQGVHVLRNSVKKTTVMAWDVFIDDKNETIWEFTEAGVPILAPARPWNEAAGIERFESWQQVPGLLP